MSEPGPDAAAVKPSALDAVGVVMALLYGLPSLLYPPAPDQSLFFYVGRVWWGGGLPYRDVFDQKPPGIFALYALAGGLFGGRLWAVLACEWAAIVLVGWLVASVAGNGRRGVWGFSCAAFAVVYYSSFDYWSFGQVEYWQALLGLASFVVVWRGDSSTLPRRALLAGFLAGLGVCFKPALTVLVTVALLGWRAWSSAATTRARSVVDALLRYAAGALLALLIATAPFALRSGGLRALVDAVFIYSSYYVAETTHPFSFDWSHFGPAVGASLLVVIVAAAVSWRRGRSDRWRVLGWSIALFAAAIATVAAQRKYLLYHWVVLVPFVALLLVWAAGELSRSWRAPLGLLVLTTAAFLRFVPNHYSPHLLASWRYVTGRITHQNLTDRFGGLFGNNYATLTRVAAVINREAKPGDTLCVRGYRPAIYLLTGLRCPSRFPWEQHLGDVWLDSFQPFPVGDLRNGLGQQHRAMLQKTPPTFIVGFTGWPDDLRDRYADGYRPLATIDGAAVLERMERRDP